MLFRSTGADAVTGAEKVASASPAAGAKSRQDFEKESTGRDEKSQAKEPPALHSKAPRAMTPRPPKAEAEVAVGGGSVGGILSGSGRGIGPGTAGAKIVPPASTTESVEVTAAAPAINSVTNAAPAAPPPRVPSVTQTVTVEEAAPLQRKAQSEITADTSSAQTLAIDGRNVADLMLLTPGTGLPISAPGGNILWRAGRGGRVLNSRDSGAHWKKQKSHVKVDLSNGSAPSAEVCWMVGSAGTILRTVDGGAHWKKVTSPMAGEIAGISAADAQHAAVWDANKTNTFVTADGGISWSTVAK